MKETGFIALDLATKLYLEVEKLKLKNPVRDQLLRASLSIALNITEGSGRSSLKDKKRFYSIAMGSLRETQTLIRIIQNQDLAEKYNHLGALVYGLTQKT